MTIHVKDNLGAFRQALHEAAGQQDVPIPELFTTGFLTQHTQFSSCEEMFQYLVTTNSVQHPKELTREQMDAMAITRTSFSSWREMLGTAHAERVQAEVRSRLSQ